MRRAILITALVFGGLAAAERPTPAEQMAAFEQLRAKVCHGAVATDAEGDVIYVELLNHGIRERKLGREVPPLTAEDMQLFNRFPDLRAIYLESLGAPAESYAVFSDKPLEYVNVKSASWKDQDIPPIYLTHFDSCRDLRELNLYHNWYRGGEEPAPWSEMQGFPELRRFAGELNLSSGDAVIDLLEHSPRLEFLDLQRSSLSDDQLAELFGLLPEVRIVKWKPGHGFDPAQLRHLQLLPQLEYLILEFKDALPLPFEDGLEHLAPIATLDNFRMHFSEEELTTQVEWLPLAAARPDLTISRYRLLLAPLAAGEEPGDPAPELVPPYPAYVDFMRPTTSSTSPKLAEEAGADE